MSKSGKGGQRKEIPNQGKRQPSGSSQGLFFSVARQGGVLIGSSLRGILRWLRENLTLKDLLIWASVIIGIFAGAFAFLPRVTVEPSGAYDPSNPSPITFVITNTNIVPLRDVQVAIGVCYLGFGDQSPRQPECNGPALSHLIFTPWRTEWLDTDEKFLIALEEAMKDSSNPRRQFDTANITIGVYYYPWRVPWFWKPLKEFRFITKRMSDGKIYWTPTPLNR